MKMNVESETRINPKNEASPSRRQRVMEHSSLYNFSRRLQHLKLWVNARLDTHHHRTLSLRVHRRNRTD